MLNSHQDFIFNQITLPLGITFDKNKVNIVQEYQHYQSSIDTGDIAVATFVALGLSIEKLGVLRGLEDQEIVIDRRHAAMALRSCDYLFLNGWHVDYSYAQSPISNFYKTNDSKWIFYAGAYPTIRRKMLDFLKCSDNTFDIATKTKRYDADFLENSIAEIGGSSAYCRTVEEWRSHPQGKDLLKNDLIQIESLKKTNPVRLSPAITRPLSKIRVLDFTRVIAGPTIGRILAEQGADVIHVIHPYLDRILAFEMEASFGKKTVFLDYKKESDKELILNLVKDADVILCGDRGNAMMNAGLGEDDIRKINSNIIFVQIHGYGFTGPWSQRRGWEQLAQVCTGIAYLSKKHDQPSLLPVFLNDYLTGYLGALGTIAALIRRHENGGQLRVRLSLAKTAMFASNFYNLAEKDFVALTKDDFKKYLIDQNSHLGVFTRLKPVIAFSLTPSFAYSSGSFPGSNSLNIRWDSEFSEYKINLPHYKSKLADQQMLRVGDYAKNYVL